MSTNRTLAPTPDPGTQAAVLILDEARPALLKDASAWPDEALTAADRKALAKAEFDLARHGDDPTGRFRPVEHVTIDASSGSWAEPGPEGGSMQPYLSYPDRRAPADERHGSSRVVRTLTVLAFLVLLAAVGSSVWLVAHAYRG